MKIEFYKEGLEHEMYWLSPFLVLQLLEMLIEARDELFGLVEYSSLNQKMKDRLFHLVSQIDQKIRAANQCGEFDETVHRAMLRRVGLADNMIIDGDQQVRLSKEYQRAIEFYISSLVGKKKA